MGDQIGQSVSGRLYYVPFNEFQRIRQIKGSSVDVARIFSALCRINILYMIARAGSGHIGSSFSSIDIMSWIELNHNLKSVDREVKNLREYFFSSKGHDAPALYSTWLGSGKMPFEKIHELRRLNGLPGHPDVSIPHVVTNTGSLGMGISKAKGIILGKRLLGEAVKIVVLVGDGEMQEGQFWESLISAANLKMHELTVIVDHNKMQSDSFVSKVSDLGDMEAKLKAFGWRVTRCDGNNMNSIYGVLEDRSQWKDQPRFIIADTVKGKGVSFMEHTSLDSDTDFYKFHSGAPSEANYLRASEELIDSANRLLQQFNEMPVSLESVNRPNSVTIGDHDRLIPTYSKALEKQASFNQKIVALDADLILDTGLVNFRERFPNRFIECGIAEQDMVSQAGGLALVGFIPIVHSFSCFLSARSNEQIYNNSTEKTKIIYVGSLAGLLPAGPGHSHQAVRDLGAVGGVPGLTIIEPCCSSEVEKLLEWSINVNQSSSYIRLVSIPWEINFTLPENYIPILGRGVKVWGNGSVAIVAYGPIMVSNAVQAGKLIKAEIGFDVAVINMPWLNHVDTVWLSDLSQSTESIIVIDNHYLIGGLGDRIIDAISVIKHQTSKIHRMAVNGIPHSGSTMEVLDVHDLGVDSIVKKVRSLVQNNFKSS